MTILLPCHPARLCHTATLLIIGTPLAKRIRQPAAHNVRKTKADRRASHQSSCAELVTEALLPPTREHQVRRAPGGCEACAVGLEAVEVEICGEEEDGREKHGQSLEWASMLGNDEGCEEGWWQWVL